MLCSIAGHDKTNDEVIAGHDSSLEPKMHAPVDRHHH